jgi:HD-like signal output (HDOD) protein
MEKDLAELDREAEQIIKDIGIPPCPAILTKLMREMREDEPDFIKLGKLIGGDVSLAAAMLKTVNSPFYGLRTKVASVHQAIAMLGLRHVAQLVTGLLLKDAFAGGTSDLMDEIWESSSGIAEINATLARHFKGVNRDEAYTFALFRDCGALAMVGKYDGYRPLLPGGRVEGGGCVVEYEDKCFGMNHARMGYHLAKSWLLPDDICVAVLAHHEYDMLAAACNELPAASAKCIALSLAAEELFVRQNTGKSSPEWERGGALALERLEITQDELDEMAAEDLAIMRAAA